MCTMGVLDSLPCLTESQGMAMNMLAGQGNKQQKGSGGLGGLASSFLGSGSLGGAQGGGSGNLVGQLAGGLLGSNKQSGRGGPAGGLGQLAGSLLGGGQKPNQQGQGRGASAGGLGGLVGGFIGGQYGSVSVYPLRVLLNR